MFRHLPKLFNARHLLIPALLVPALAVSALAVAAENRPGPVDSANMPRLLDGDVLHEFAHRDEPGGAISAEILMRTKVEDIWSVLTGCEQYFVFVAGLEQCEILEQSGEYVLTHQLTDLGFLVPAQDYIYESKRQPYSRIDFKLVEGNIKTMQGYWKFDTIAEGVLVSYSMQVRPAYPVPRFLVRHSLGKLIPDMLACIRGLVEDPGTAKQNASDLERCPGDPY